VVARSPESRERARAGGAASVVGAVEDLPPVEGIIVVTPTRTHAEVVERSLERGVPVFVEKPLTDDVAAAERLAEAAGERLFVMDKWRYHRGVEALAALARSGELGPVIGLRSTRVGWSWPPKDVDAAWHLLPHDLAIAREILGEVPAPRAAAAELEGGVAVTLSAVLGQSPWMVAEVSGRRRRHFREVRVVFRDGTAVLGDSYADHLAITRAAGNQAATAPLPERLLIANAGEMPLRRELEAFLGHLRGGPSPRSSVREGLDVVRTIAELRRLAGL
jgi:predicted dehydrogenase